MISFKKPDVEQFFRTLGIQVFAVSSDEKQLTFSTNLNGKYNLWAMDLPNTFPYPLTFHDQSCQSIAYDKEGRFIVASFDTDGDEKTQLYAIPPKGGTIEPLRVTEGERHFFTTLSENGKRLYYTGTKGNSMYLNSYCYDVETGEEKTILQGDMGATYLVNVSPNEESFVYIRHFSNTYTLAWVKKENEDLLLTPYTEKQHTVSSPIYITSDEVYFLTNYQHDRSYLAKFNIATREFSKVIVIENEDLSMLKYDKERKSMYIVSSKGVEDRLYQFDVETKKLVEVISPVSVIEQIVVSELGNIYIMGRSARRPHNIYFNHRGSQEWKPLTQLSVPGVLEEELVEPDIITYPSFDGLEIEALFFKPKEEVDNRHVILWPHGGPQALERKSFRSLFQFLVSRGYSIFAPNFRGSTKYGLRFMKMVEGDWGHGPRLDNVNGLEWIIKAGYADRDKILLMGGSYGGYMALLLHGRHSEYFKAVVDIFGVSNLFSFMNTVPEHWKPTMKQWVGDPVEDKERLMKDSPTTYLDTMTKPMLVIQGAKDPRVVKAESDQIVAALKDKGRDVHYIVLDDEGHGFSKKENEMRVYQAVLRFFDRFI